MNEVKINVSHPHLNIPLLFDDPGKNEKPITGNEMNQNQFRFTTASSMEENNIAEYRKANPVVNKVSKPAPTSENWIG